MNVVCLSGTIGKEVSLSTTNNGSSVFNNTLKVSKKDLESFTWVNIIAYNELAEEISASYKIDDYVLIQGTLTTRTWLDKYEERRYLTEVIINKIERIG